MPYTLNLKRRYLTLYISGAISNDPNYKSKFNTAYQRIKMQNPKLIVINPATISYIFNHVNLAWHDYIKIDLDLLAKCDIIYFLNDWKSSEGAQIEHIAAQKYKKIILYENEHEPDSFDHASLVSFIRKHHNITINYNAPNKFADIKFSINEDKIIQDALNQAKNGSYLQLMNGGAYENSD